MPLSRILKKASSFILRSQYDESSTPAYNDGEIVFCKNNVCVHPPTLVRQETDILHHPGYLTVACQVSGDKPTLFLSWMPNTTLRRHPATVEQRSLSVTRAGEGCSGREADTRRRSSSAIALPGLQAGRRYSSGSYETECTGCFPESSGRLSSSDRHDVHSSKGSLSSCSDNSSLTPTEESLARYEDAAAKPKKSNNEAGVAFTAATRPVGDERNENCDRNVAKERGRSPESSTLEPSLLNCSKAVVKQKRPSGDGKAYHGSLVDSSDIIHIRMHNDVAVDSGKTPCSEKAEEKSDADVPNENDRSSPKSGTIDSNSNREGVGLDDENRNSEEAVVGETQVPIDGSDHRRVNSNHNSHSNSINNNNSSRRLPSFTDGGACNGAANGDVRKENTTRSSLVRPEGTVYIDSLVLQENPHILNRNVHAGDCRSGRAKEFVKRMSNGDKETRDSRWSRPSVQSNEENLAPSWMSSPELLALKHNLNFPDSVTASPVVRRAQRCCRKFCVDLSEMRSLRLFFSDPESTRGQLVVASRECQYKILHFHHGGLERLATVLQQWHLLSSTVPSDNLPYRHFMVCRPAVDDSELHPEEGRVSKIGEADWKEMLNPLGQVEDDLALRKGIFLGGLEPNLRTTVWPFLLHCYSYQSTATEREHVTEIRRQEYKQITNRRLTLEGAAKEKFLRNIQCVVEKDVIRTDRGNPYYAGESNPHVETMKNILLNFAIYDAGSGYMQGMSDLLAPVLAEIGNEADSFWCFVGLMSRAIFVCTPTDSDMERNLTYLRELIREMVPAFYAHLQRHTDAMELLFCHRWILLCFKREFPEEVALRMWEACWANYLTDYFNLFLCLAIVSAYADDVIAQDLRTDEMLLHFSSLALFMDGDLILRKARGLLYQFRQRTVIPCSLAGLCQECGPGMWDSGHAPTVVCRGTSCPQSPCPYRGISTSGD